MIRIAFAVLIGTFLLAGNAIAACPNDPPVKGQPKAPSAKSRVVASNCVDLNTVSQISANIVATEPAPAVKRPTYVEPASKPYEGPTLGMTKPDPGVRATPTVGYHWSLE